MKVKNLLNPFLYVFMARYYEAGQHNAILSYSLQLNFRITLDFCFPTTSSCVLSDMALVNPGKDNLREIKSLHLSGQIEAPMHAVWVREHSVGGDYRRRDGVLSSIWI